MQRMKGLKRAIVLAGLILAGLAPAWAQDLYVIHNGNNYLSHNATTGAVNTTSTTTFDPATCFWTISGNYLRPVNSSGTVLGNLYLRPRSGNSTYSLNTNTSTTYAAWSSGLNDGGQPTRTQYLRLNGTTWQMSTTNSNRGTLRLVTVTPVSTTSTNPTISGADVLTATGNSTYTASGAAYRAGGYTNYHFNNADHFLNGNTAITPANATIGAYTWSLESNAYATVNSTSGVVTVASLPEYDIILTLTVTATATGGTPAAPANTTLTGTKQITIQGTKPSAPTITVNGTSVTLATTAAGSTTIRYTLDGTDPTASTGTVYSEHHLAGHHQGHYRPQRQYLRCHGAIGYARSPRAHHHHQRRDRNGLHCKQHCRCDHILYHRRQYPHHLEQSVHRDPHRPHHNGHRQGHCRQRRME